MANILITGGSGLVGRAISELLFKQGHEVRWLSREEGSEANIIKFKWDLSKQYIDENAFKDLDVLVHLAGAGIVDKAWTDSYKKEIYDSRVKSSELLFHYISKNNYKIKHFIGGSAIGYYGSENSGHTYLESDAAGCDFLSRTCVDWEKSYFPFSEKGIRTTVIRTGIVLSKDGGAYPKMATAFKFGLGAALGNGKQYFSWIHLHDLAAIFVKAIRDEQMNGVYNAVASEQVTNKEFSRALAKSFRKVFFLPNIPGFLLQLVMGERVITLIGGLKVSNTKIKSTGFNFEFDNLEKALEELAH